MRTSPHVLLQPHRCVAIYEGGTRALQYLCSRRGTAEQVWTLPACPGVRHYLVNAPHSDMAQHKTTYALLRELLPLHSCPPGELQTKLDLITQHAFIAGVPSSWVVSPTTGLGDWRTAL